MEKVNIIKVANTILEGSQIEVNRHDYIGMRSSLMAYARFTYGDDEKFQLIISEIQRLDLLHQAGAYHSHKWFNIIYGEGNNVAVIITPEGTIGLVLHRQFMILHFGMSEWEAVRLGILELKVPEDTWKGNGKIKFAFKDRDLVFKFTRWEWADLLDALEVITPEYIETRIEKSLKTKLVNQHGQILYRV